MSKLMNTDSFNSYSLELFPLEAFESANFHLIHQLQPLEQLHPLGQLQQLQQLQQFSLLTASPPTFSPLL
jgi:hypothetical protein